MESKTNTKFNLFKIKNSLSVKTKFKVVEPDYERNLSPDVYRPFLERLFSAFAKQNPNHHFLLTGSAAKQLQDNKQGNPNDIDILIGVDEDLDECIALLEFVLQQVPGANVKHNNHQGTLAISYYDKLLKVQIIDFKTSHHCYPAEGEGNNIKQKGAIKMLNASVIPSKNKSISATLR